MALCTHSFVVQHVASRLIRCVKYANMGKIVSGSLSMVLANREQNFLSGYSIHTICYLQKTRNKLVISAYISLE